MTDEYNCVKCGDEWGWFPEDYDHPEDFERICPFCGMTKRELFSEVYKSEGLIAAIKAVLKRI